MESEGQPASSDGPAPVPPMLKWAQRRDRLFITLDVQDVTGAVVSLSEDALVFSGQGCDGRWHEMNLSFYKPVDPKHPESKWVNTGRDFRLNIMKVDVADEHWPRLIVEKGTLQRIQVDWARYADEDEEDQIELAGGSGFDFSELGGGMDFSSMVATAHAGDGRGNGRAGEAEGEDSVVSALEDDDGMPDLIPANQRSQDLGVGPQTDNASMGTTDSND